MAEIRLENISMRYGPTLAVDDISLTVNDGEFFSLLGPSGCGKSTLLNVACGLLKPTSGDVYIDGQNVNSLSPRERGIAMVFQDYALYPHMTVSGNLAFPLRAERWRKNDIKRKVSEVSEVLELGPLLKRYPRELSGGQRQRVALGRALVRDPKVFLMDEPLSNLDARLRLQMRKELRILQERIAATVIYVTHDQAEAMTLSDRMAVMSDGKMQQVGKPIDLYDYPANLFVARFLGDVGMNLLDGRLDRTGAEAYWRSGALVYPIGQAGMAAAEQLSDGHPLVLGVHPENVEICGPSEKAWARGRVILREQLGAEQHLHVELDGRSIVVRASPHISVEAGAELSLRLRSNSTHVFDSMTGMALRSADVPESAARTLGDSIVDGRRTAN